MFTPKQKIILGEICLLKLKFSLEQEIFNKWRISRDIRKKNLELKKSMGSDKWKTFLERGKKKHTKKI